jgi:predicted DNA-binding protein (MmcQ/YjbR family)
MDLNERTGAVKAWLDAKPGAAAEPAAAGTLIYKVMGKMFAILSTRGFEGVSLKCDPHLAEILREQYAGVGHRYHLDRRHWISVRLDADVPLEEVEPLTAQSYDLVCAGLTRRQRAELEGQSRLSSS